MVLDFIVREEPCVDVHVSQQDHPDVFLFDLEEPEKMRDHVLAVQGHRQQAFFIVTSSATGFCTQGRRNDATGGLCFFGRDKKNRQGLFISNRRFNRKASLPFFGRRR